MKALITGLAGFIGFHTARALFDRQVDVVGIDNLNGYYDIGLKKARLAELPKAIRFEELDIASHEAFQALVQREAPDVLIHLAAQPGVRHSIENPFAYAQANLVGHLSVLEACRHAPALSHLIYASSSSVYGDDTPLPLTETAPVNRPVSLYAATKCADELMSSAYAHLYGLKQLGLRFFTVYGRWGRPDMAYWIFTEKILRGEPINVFNHGRTRRDMTHVNDVVEGIVSAVCKAPRFAQSDRPHTIYNLGNHRSEPLIDVIRTLENAIAKPAIMKMLPAQPGDVVETYADISAMARDYDYAPRTAISEGLPDFINWFRAYSGL
ncbi:MAG: NAD-dependent epimerase/dehydratase family protein [Pseudomonadota bacterium]